MDTPEKVGPTPARGSDHGWALALVIFGALVSWFRLDPVARDTLWAEDGPVFLADAMDESPAAVLLQPYQGYLHLLPRLIAAGTASWVPIEASALAMTIGSCLVVGLVAALVFVCAQDVVVWRPARIAVAVLTFVAPVVSYEILGNAANVHWYALWLAPWLLLAAPRRRRSALLLGTVGLIIALTEVQVLFFLPLIAWRARDPNRWIVWGGVALGSVLQLVAVFAAPRDAGAGRPPIGSTTLGYMYHVPMGAIFPTRSAKALWVTELGWWGAVVVLVPFLIAAAWVLWRGQAVERVAAVALMGGSVVVWTAAYVVNSNPDYFYSLLPLNVAVERNLDRYGAVPAMYLLATVILATSVAWRVRMLRRTAIAALGFVMALTVAIAALPHRTARAEGPEWTSGIAGARAECASADNPDQVVSVPMAPDGWSFALRCSSLDD